MFKMCTTDLWDGSGSAEARAGGGGLVSTHSRTGVNAEATWGRQEDVFRLSQPQEPLSGLTTGRRWGAWISFHSWSMNHSCQAHCSYYSIGFFMLDWCGWGLCVWEGGVVKCYACLSCNVFSGPPWKWDSKSQGSILQIHSNMTVGGAEAMWRTGSRGGEGWKGRDRGWVGGCQGATLARVSSSKISSTNSTGFIYNKPSSLRGGGCLYGINVPLTPSKHTHIGYKSKTPWSDFMPINSLTIF